MDVRRVLLTLAVAVLAAPIAGRQNPVFRGTVDTVAIYPLVSTNTGQLVTDLKPEDFTVLDNGQPAAITVFSSVTQPITAVLLLDMSDSMDDNVVRVREAAGRLVDALEPTDRLRIGTFGAEIVMSPILTSDKRLLHRVLREELWPGGSTRLWQALDAAMQSLANETGRRTIVALTDGIDTTSATQTAVTQRAVNGLFMVYAVSLEGKGLSTRLTSLITSSGGAIFQLKQRDDLDRAVARVATELRHQYMLGFTPNVLDGKPHTLEVRVNRPGFAVRAPLQFVAAQRR
jgi:Ca-activated chloride channel family protein